MQLLNRCPDASGLKLLIRIAAGTSGLSLKKVLRLISHVVYLISSFSYRKTYQEALIKNLFICFTFVAIAQ